MPVSSQTPAAARLKPDHAAASRPVREKPFRTQLPLPGNACWLCLPELQLECLPRTHSTPGLFYHRGSAWSQKATFTIYHAGCRKYNFNPCPYAPGTVPFLHLSVGVYRNAKHLKLLVILLESDRDQVPSPSRSIRSIRWLGRTRSFNHFFPSLFFTPAVKDFIFLYLKHYNHLPKWFDVHSVCIF